MVAADFLATTVNRCVAAFLLLASLVVGSFLLLRFQADTASKDARLVNMSGRQRMLVSRSAREAENLFEATRAEAPAIAASLRQLAAQLRQTHLGFVQGSGELEIPPPSAEVRAVFLKEPYLLHQRMVHFLDGLDQIAEDPKSDAAEAAREMVRATLAATGAAAKAPAETTPSAASTTSCPACQSTPQQAAGLAGLDRVVGILQRDSEQRMATMKVTAVVLLMATLLTLWLTARYVFWPIIQQVRGKAASLAAAHAAAEARAGQLEEAVAELELLREEDNRRATAMLNVMHDLKRERAQLQREALIRERAERQFRSVVEAAPNAMIMINQQGNMVLVNKAAELVFQYEARELIGKPVEMLLPERFRPDHPRLRSGFFDSPRTTLIGQGRELFGRRKDGTEFVIEIGLNPIETDEGLFMLSSVVDMTSHIEANECTSLLAAIVESSHDAIIGESLDGIITSWNRGAEEIYRYSAEEAVGQGMSFLIPEDRRDEPQEITDKIRAGERVDNRETVRRRRDGKLIDVALTASPIIDHSGQILGASVIARDITGRKRAERKLEEYARELEKSNRDLQEFAYVASHDLKEPLRMVSSFTTLLGEEYRGKLSPEADKYIAYATDGAQRMSALIDDLLDYSRVGRGDTPFEAVDLHEIVQPVIKDLQTRITEENAEVIIVDQLPTVHGKSGLLSQLLMNLIGNALKFRHPDRDPVVRVTCEQRGDMWELAVHDNGIGIEEDYHERIFHVFQRLHTAEEYPGTGIGLAVCKKIVDHHQGQIRVASRLDEGTAIHFTLPAQRKEPIDPCVPKSSAITTSQEYCSA